jgi:prefoldin alpha subunit
MDDTSKVMLEVGAGYFIEDNIDKAREYCDRKSKTLNENGNKVAEIIQLKKLQLGKVEAEYKKRVEQMQAQMAA